MSDLLRVEELDIKFRHRGRVVSNPVRGLSLTVNHGEVLGIVGETGCGKSLTALAVMGLVPEGATQSGRIVFDSVEQDSGRTSTARGDAVSLVFQNPGTAFNPVYTLGSQLSDVVKRHRGLPRRKTKVHVLKYLELVGLPDPSRVFDSYPHELSGGMLQRAMIAMALLCEPQLLILDEPTTALDVTVARQILGLVLELRDRLDFGVLLITHNLGVVQEVCDSVAVLYAGRVVERGPTEVVLSSPAHPYTRGLLSALPARHASGTPLATISGSVPGNLLGLLGCGFAERCPLAQPECLETDPRLEPLSARHEVACIRVGER